MENNILVVVVTYNGAKWFDRCFGSLYTSDVPVDIFIVDNGSTDGTLDLLHNLQKDGGARFCTGRWAESETRLVKLVESKDNLGFGRANNQGLRYAATHSYEYVYLMNEDAWLEEDTLSKLIEASKENVSFGILSPIQMTADMKRMDPRFHKKFPYPDLADKIEAKAENSKLIGEGLFENESKSVIPVEFVMAAHWLITRQCLITVGGFSPAFHHYGEDDNYINRAVYNGFAVGVVLDAKAVHDRENRPETKAFKMRLKSVAAVVKLSNPNQFLLPRLIWQPIELILMSIRYRWAQSFKDAFKLIGDYDRLVKIRRMSKRSGAFLKDFF